MYKINHNLTKVQRRKLRTRKKLHGLVDQPRVSVHRTNKHIFIQAIDDQAGKTLAAIGDQGLKLDPKNVNKTEKAKLVAVNLATQLKSKNIQKAIFDRGSYRYHGRVKAVAETLRENGISI